MTINKEQNKMKLTSIEKACMIYLNLNIEDIKLNRIIFEKEQINKSVYE